MRIPLRVKQIIAVTLGIVLLVATIVAITRDYTASNNASVPENNTVQTEKADNKQEAEDKKDTPTTENKTNPSKTPENKESDKTVVVTNNFVFTAKPGDNYTAFARDAIRQYAVKNKLDISEERMEQASATLAYQAGSPFLEVGQVVTITTNDVSKVLGNKSEAITPIADATSPKKDTPEAPSKTTYSFTAESGDSYALLARKAIDEYSKSTNTALNPEQRIAAETFIISDAGFPAIDTNQQVSFSYDTVKGAVTKATGLSPAELQNWQPYATLAGF